MSQTQVNSYQTVAITEKRSLGKVGRSGPALLRFWHQSSLDAPTVALVWSLSFAWVARIRLPMWAPCLLGLVVWAIYIVDRLLDARAGLQVPPLHLMRDRHYFHWRHRHLLGAIATAALAASAWMVIELIPAGARTPDSVVGAATLAYLSGIHSRRKLPPLLDRVLSPFFTREFLVGVLFTAGCLLPLWSRTMPSSSPLFRLLIVPAFYFTSIAWLNCHAIGRWEADACNTSHPAGWNRLRITACATGVVGLLLSASRTATCPRVALLLAMGAGSAFLLASLDAFRPRLQSVTLRAAADLVLLMPVFVLPLAFLSK